jgi:hypothetical protein
MPAREFAHRSGYPITATHARIAGPLVIGAVLKIGYVLMLYRPFRHVRPPQEGGDSESDTEASVDVTAFERCPSIDGPAAVDGARLEKQRVPARLPHPR